MPEESEALTQENAWLRAYLETLCYHTETFNALRELGERVALLTNAIDIVYDDVQVLLRQTHKKGLYGGDAKEQAGALSQTKKTEGFGGPEL